MKTSVNELRKKIDGQVFQYKHAVSNGIMVNRVLEQTKNVLFNNMDEIAEALKLAEDAEKRIAELQANVDFAEAELRDMDDEIKKLRNAAASKPAAKGKVKAKEETMPEDENVK